MSAENTEPDSGSVFSNIVVFEGSKGETLTCLGYSADYLFSSPVCELEISGETVLSMFGRDLAVDTILAYEGEPTRLFPYDEAEGVRREDKLWAGFRITEPGSP